MDRSSEFAGLLKLFSEQREGPPLLLAEATVETDFSEAVQSITVRFESTQRHLDTLRKLVDQRSLFYNEPGAEIDELSSVFDEEDKELDRHLQLLSSWIEKQTPRRSQRRKLCEIVVTALKSRRAEHALQFQEALRTRTEVFYRP